MDLSSPGDLWSNLPTVVNFFVLFYGEKIMRPKNSLQFCLLFKRFVLRTKYSLKILSDLEVLEGRVEL